MATLINALKTNDRAAAAALLNNPATPLDETDENGSIALHIVCMQNWLEAAQFLVKRGQDVNSRNKFGATPLFLAAKLGAEQTVAFLLEAGADPHIANQNNVTPQDIAKHSGHTKVASMIGAVSIRRRPQQSKEHMIQNILKRKQG